MEYSQLTMDNQIIADTKHIVKTANITTSLDDDTTIVNSVSSKLNFIIFLVFAFSNTYW